MSRNLATLTYLFFLLVSSVNGWTFNIPRTTHVGGGGGTVLVQTQQHSTRLGAVNKDETMPLEFFIRKSVKTDMGQASKIFHGYQ
jgi:hypothetical protein